MIRGTRLVASLALVAIALAGPLAPYAAAQAPPGPAVVPPMTQPPPDLYQQELKQQQEEASAYDTGAVIANIVYVPGKGILCGLGAITGVGILLVTFGSGYKAAAFIGREGCGGRWLLSGDDLRPDRPLSDWQQY